jgi:hypothetical protein
VKTGLRRISGLHDLGRDDLYNSVNLKFIRCLALMLARSSKLGLSVSDSSMLVRFPCDLQRSLFGSLISLGNKTIITLI